MVLGFTSSNVPIVCSLKLGHYIESLILLTFANLQKYTPSHWVFEVNLCLYGAVSSVLGSFKIGNWGGGEGFGCHETKKTVTREIPTPKLFYSINPWVGLKARLIFCQNQNKTIFLALKHLIFKTSKLIKSKIVLLLKEQEHNGFSGFYSQRILFLAGHKFCKCYFLWVL